MKINVAHPFMDGNGCSASIGLDLMFRRSLKRCADWSKIDKKGLFERYEKKRGCFSGHSTARDAIAGCLSNGRKIAQ